jgi:hypothetical protein
MGKAQNKTLLLSNLNHEYFTDIVPKEKYSISGIHYRACSNFTLKKVKKKLKILANANGFYRAG